MDNRDRSDRRLIEDYLPVGQISYESTREKLLRRRDAHISMLHQWWARRPLAAARAAIYATLVPASTKGDDPAALQQRFVDLCRWVGPQTDKDTAGRFQKALEQARAEIRAAYPDAAPKVLDCFAGGGAIPLEALRLGCETYALDLNPVAHLIQLCSLVYPQQFGASLAQDVAEWGRWMIERAYDELKDLYPTIPDPAYKGAATIAPLASQPTLTNDGTTLTADDDTEDDEGSARPLVQVPPGRLLPIAYLWTRTVRCPNPTCGADVPVLRQTWLVKKSKRKVAIRATADRATRQMRYEIVEVTGSNQLAFDPSIGSERGNTTCPFCGGSVPNDVIQSQGQSVGLGIQPTAVVVVVPGRRGKLYFAAGDIEVAPLAHAIDNRLHQLETNEYTTVPNEELQRGKSQYMPVPNYGLVRWGDLFTKRQLVMLLTFVELIHAAYTEMRSQGVEAERAKAIATYLGLALDRVVDRSSTLCLWDNSAEKTAHTYSRNALPMVWDFAEVNPFAGSSGDISAAIRAVCHVINHCAQAVDGLAGSSPARSGAHVYRGSATRIPLSAESLDAVITDPPYYDNVPYADLADFFYVWLKRSVGFLYPEHFANPATPKRQEAVAFAPNHSGSKIEARKFYETTMLQSFEECNRILKPGAPLVVVYAHKTTSGWATLVDALRRARFMVTEAWPLDTEMPDRIGQQGTASLASSIFIVARRRDGEVTGDYATQVGPQLRGIIAERVKTLMALGVTGADLVIATIGAGLRAYTQFARVELPNGEELDATRYLEEVQREALEVILAEVLHCDRRGVGAVDKPTRFYVLGRYEYGGAAVEFDEMNVLAHGVGVELKGLSGLMDDRHPLASKTKEGTRLRDYTERGAEPTLGEPTAGVVTPPLVDVLQRLLWLAEHEPSQIPLLLSVAQPDLERLRLVAEALQGRTLAAEPTPGAVQDLRTPEQAAIGRLLASWKRVVADAPVTIQSGLWDANGQ